MRNLGRHLPNALSGIRLALVPILWVCALGDRPQAIGVGIVVAGLTDVLDGFLARKLGVESPAGAALDSLADNLLFLSVAAWLVMLRPDVVARFGPWLIICVGFDVAFLTVGMIRFRRFGNLHLYSAKAAAAVGAVFVVTCFLSSGVPVLLGTAAFSAATLAVVESLACVVVCDRVDENMGSLVAALRRRRDRAPRPRGKPTGGGRLEKVG